MPLTWWAQVVSNHRPLACKASALPLSYAPSITAQVTGLRYPAPWLSVNRGRSARHAVRSEHPVKRPGYVLGQRGRRIPRGRSGRSRRPLPRGPARSRRPIGGSRRIRARRLIAASRRIGGGGRICGRLPYLAAVAALDLAQSPYQADRPAVRAAIEIRSPVAPGLALRADQHLAVPPHPALPGARAPGRVHLPGTASITGHLADSAGIRPSRGRPAPSGNRRCRGPAGSGSRLSTAPRRPCR